MSFVMAAAMTGCGKDKTESVPDLLDPVSTNEAYRPVTYGDIGRMVIKTGTIVPTDNCYYYDTSATLSKVYVNVGDKVKKGTLLADAGSGSESDAADDGSSVDDPSASDPTMDDGSVDGTSDDDAFSHNIKEKIFEQNQTELDWRIKACDEIGDKEGADAARIEKAINAENNRYENVLYEYEQKKKLQEKEDSEKLQKNGTLKADGDGYVTYAKKVKGTETTVAGGENVVVVSDYSQPYIEITGEKFKKGNYSLYKNMYAVVDGKKYDIELYKYTNQEIAVAQSMSSMPYTRFKLKGVKNPGKILSVGNTVSLYFSTSEAKNVLTIGNDSLYEENGQTFVYIKTDSSSKERRDIEIGVSDSNYTEVVSGLKEGDLVYYASDAIMPSDYSEYTVSLDSYTKTAKVDSDNFTVEDLNSVSYVAPCDGRFTKLNIKKGKKVKKGDLLFQIDSGGGSAAMKNIDNQIESENQSYTSDMKNYDDQINDLTRQIKHYQSGKVATPTDANNTLYMAEQLTCQRNVLSLNKEMLTHTHNATISSLNAQKEKLNKNNDGSGKISVYAEQTGIVLSVDGSTDVAVKEGQSIVTIGSNENVILAVTISDGKLAINQKVTIINKSNTSKKFTGTCVGTTGDGDRNYIETDSDGNVHITKSSGDSDLKYYIQVSDSSFYKKPKAYQVSYPTVAYENVVMIPSNMIYHETSKKNASEYDYVWLLKDDEIIKQYVTLGDSDKSKTIILSGLQEGDVIAKESGATSSRKPSPSEDKSGSDSSGGDSSGGDSSGGDSSGGDSSGGDSSGSDSGADSGLGSDDGSDSDSVED